ncbi:hypothetical protein [Streptomyces sp. NWU339]|uniref:hypothetical protein n=1 Tax=Streptomyces sp. NWU339 TaxID=2185284 RepID=UPI0015E814B9|nr:hypothetical protein [Streptomyces sp. NWU339]
MTPTGLITSALTVTAMGALVHFGPSTASRCQPAPLHERFDHSHVYAVLASPGDRTS